MNNYTFEVFKGPTVAKGTVKEAFSSKKRTLPVEWKKLKKVSGYQIQISEKKDFTKGTRAKSFKASNTKAAAGGLKSRKPCMGKGFLFLCLFYLHFIRYNNRKIKWYLKWAIPGLREELLWINVHVTALPSARESSHGRNGFPRHR